MRTNPKRDSESVWLRALQLSLGLLASFSVGCTIDLSDIPLLGNDASTRIDGGEDSGPGCDGVIDGTSCGTGRICLDEVCVTSTCGDGVVDRARGEECEPPQANCVECGWSCDGGACDDGGARCLNDASMSEVELCDGMDNDCDGVIDEGAPVVFVDADMDGVGNSTMPVACTLGLGYSALGNDCNDADPNISPLAQEDCDTPADDNCNASVNEDCPCEAGTTQACGPTDGEGNPITEGECEQGVQTCVEGKLGECSGRGPTDETCDDANDDDDCDGQVDEGLYVTCFADADGDGFAAVDSAGVKQCGLACGALTTSVAPLDAETIDCNDERASAFPGAAEACNGEDDDCDGVADNDALLTFYLDGDGDGFGTPGTTTRGCTAPDGYVDNADDCADGAAAINPNATEVCDNIDNDCRNGADNGITCACTAPRDCGTPDGAGGIEERGRCAKGTQSCTTGMWGDCVGAVGPIAETCNMADDDCDGVIDNGVQITCYVDSDRDTFAATTAGAVQACQCAVGYTATRPTNASNTDCADNAANRRPAGLAETCDMVDNDCDTTVDEGVQINCYVDGDGDGFAATTAGATQACSCGSGRTATQPTNASNTDCADNAANRRPAGLAETCDMVDNDCDTTVDEGTGTTCYADPDNDEYAIAGAATSRSCTGTCGTNLTARVPSGAGNIDCAENNANRTPGRTETCDSVDNDCDTMVDEGLRVSCYPDGDDDGFAAAGATLMSICGTSCGTNYTATAPVAGSTADCNDGNANIRPGATDGCNGVNNDCDGATDEGYVASCVDLDDRNACVSGSVQTTSCAAINRTCLNGACAGSCAADSTACVAGVNSYRICNSSGQPGVTVACSTGDGVNTWDVCRAGACVASPMVNQVHDEATGWTTSIGLFANEWMVTTINIPNDIRVFELHAVLSSVPAGSSVRIAIWEDSGGAGPQPTNRLTWSSLVGVAVGDNRITLSASRVIDLIGGRRYWIGINSSTDNVQVRNRTVTLPNGGDYNFWAASPATDATATPPTTFPSGLGGYIRGVRDFGLYVAGKELR